MPAMSHSGEANNRDDCNFKWGKKRGVGAKGDAQFYESFTYDGVEYFLYDCVYLYNEHEPEPYIGKLLKIWEQSSGKKIKVLWFFHPIEVLNWLGGEEVPKNEIFLACGEGKGLYNLNPLEAIVGKCNVICTSKDTRNCQPSEEEMKTADFIFYRTFNVANCTVSDKIDRDKIAGIKVSDLLNRRQTQSSAATSKLIANGRDENMDVVEKDTVSFKLDLPQALKGAGKAEQAGPGTKSAEKEDAGLKVSAIKDNVLSPIDVKSKETAIPKFRQEPFSDGITPPGKEADSSIEDDVVRRTKAKEKPKPVRDSGLVDDRVLKKARLIDDSSKTSEKLQSNVFLPLSHVKNKSETAAQKVDSGKEQERISDIVDGISEDKGKFSPIRDSSELEGPSKGLKPEEKKAKLSDGAWHRTNSMTAPEKDAELGTRKMEVTRRPDADTAKWFKQKPWEERIQTAYEQGTLLLLENLDPAYTSAEIEDIIWHAFGESCTAKVIQWTLFSSPHSGQAFVIFKTRAAMEKALKQLDGGCLMLPNGRPLVGSKGTPRTTGKPSKFAGHLFVEKIKLQMQREEIRNAVSTSHCSQGNTIEYEMAMEWRLLQERSEIWWKELYKRHGEELEEIRRNLKDK